MTEPSPRIELEALRDADTLHLLPTEALVATIKSLAEQLLALPTNDGSRATP